MRSFSRIAATGGAAALLLITIGLAWWTGRQSAERELTGPKKSPPASIDSIIDESKLNVVQLTPEAATRLGIQSAPLEIKSVRRTRVYGAEVTVPPGRATIAAAPVGGHLHAVSTGLPAPGQMVTKGQVLFELTPVVTPEGRANLAATLVDAGGQVDAAVAQRELAKIALERAERLLAGEAGSQRAVDEARTQRNLADATWEAATARQELLNKVMGEIERGASNPIPIAAPQTGMIRTLSALPDQEVPVGAPLFEVVDLHRVWIRVPVYAGDLDEVVASEVAQVGELSMRPGAASQPASPVAAPPSADALAGTVDLYYELDNDKSLWSPGQRVGIELPLRAEKSSPTVPATAIVFDVYGGAWVYEQTAAHEFVRRQVQVARIVGPLAVLSKGPPAGTRVVVAGTAELFGAETGFSK